MRLNSISIQNFRSLEDVEICGLGQLNVLIGKNNVGKSASIDALRYLNDSILGRLRWNPTFITQGRPDRRIVITLEFQLAASERDEYLNQLAQQASLPESRTVQIRDSAFLNAVVFKFESSPTDPQNVNAQHLLLLMESNICCEDGDWVPLLRSDRAHAQPRYLVDIAALANQIRESKLNAAMFAPENLRKYRNVEINSRFRPNLVEDVGDNTDLARWPQRKLVSFFQNAFFFSSFRQSQPAMDPTDVTVLDQGGENLPTVLHALNNNRRKTFDGIAQLVRAALPETGTLLTPMSGNQTSVAFERGTDRYRIQLHDMGGGVEQLLMILTVLQTTEDAGAVFIEEPETHLHPGAQRFLLDRLSAGERQVFITTHSPLFTNNLNAGTRVFSVSLHRTETQVTPVSAPSDLSLALESIGARNSDMLFSDAVLFLEGPSDADVFRIWSEKLGVRLDDRNITVLPLGGGTHPGRGAQQRTQVLEQISKSSTIPHLYVLDRDERSTDEVENLEQTLGDRVHVLEKRELENYLLVPVAIIAALGEKLKDHADKLERVHATTEEEVVAKIREISNQLFTIVLLKRTRAEIGGLNDSLLSRQIVDKMAGDNDLELLGDRIEAEIAGALEERVRNANAKTVVARERHALERVWADESLRLDIAPGQEILSGVFTSFGATYSKPKDAKRIASYMTVDQIDNELKDLIRQVAQLAGT